MEYIVKIHRETLKQIIDFSNQNSLLECGGYLIGQKRKNENQTIFIITAAFLDQNQGTQNRYHFFDFTRKSIEEYCQKHLKNSKVIGNFHSHGEYPAIFSREGKIMEEKSPEEFCHLIYSPKYQELNREVHVIGNKTEKPRITFFGKNIEVNHHISRK